MRRRRKRRAAGPRATTPTVCKRVGPSQASNTWTAEHSKAQSMQAALVNNGAALVLALLLALLFARSSSCSPAHEQQQQQPASYEKPFASMVNFVLVNGRANLVCDIQAPSSDDSVALILWYKDDSLAPIYTVDARKVSSLEKAKSTFDEQYSPRIGFNHRTRPAQLELDQVRPDDEGEYRCRVDFKRGRTVNTIISLRVVVPPSDLSIVLASDLHRLATSRGQSSSIGRKLSGLIGPFNEGDELQLACVAQGGKPRPQLMWRRDFNQVDSVEQNVDKEGTSVLLKIPSLNKSHLLSIFTCQATNNNLSSSTLQSSITLDLNLKPEEVILRQVPNKSDGQQQNGALLAGQTATFECSTHGSRPQATIHWQFQGHKHEPPMNVDQQQTSSRLQLAVQRSHNQRPLTCVAQNPRIPPPIGSLSQTLKLDVQYPPQLSVKLDGPSKPSDYDTDGRSPIEQQPASIQEGNDVYLSCQMDANPRPAKPILWRFNERPMQASSAAQLGSGADRQADSTGARLSSSFVITNQALVLRKVTRHQSGAYTCEATNQHGTNVSRPFELNVRHAPVCSTSQILVYETSPGQTIFLDCAIQANPSTSVHFSWFTSFAGSHEQQNVSDWLERDAAMDEQIDESSSRLKFKMHDSNLTTSALVKCRAKNEVGLQQRACLFQVSQARTPSLRHSCALTSGEHAPKSPNSLQLACKLNDHLKTEVFQMSANSSESIESNDESVLSSSSRALWAPFHHTTSLRQNMSMDGVQQQRRVVFAPNWLLAELYKAGSGSARESVGQLEHQQQQQSGSTSYELAAYIIVANGEQLARIKTLVEENKLFKDNPRDVYYVAARSDGNQTATNAGPNRQQRLLVPNDERLVGQLANEFHFTVPGLQPASRYKLLIYGQNLANKTRDWQVVRGETGVDEQDETRQQSSVEMGAKLVGSSLKSGQLADEQPQQQQRSADSAGAQLQKSIVMRSGEHDDSQQADQQQQADSAALGQLQQSPSLRPAGGQSAPLERAAHPLVQQLSQYKDYALAYAKRRPLLVVPAALIGCVALSLLLVYSAASFAALLRNRTRHRLRPLSNRSSTSNNDEEDEDSNDRKSASSEQFAQHFAATRANGTGGTLNSSDNKLAHCNGAHHSSVSPAVSFSSSSNGRTTTTTSGMQASPPHEDVARQLLHAGLQTVTDYALEPSSIDCQLLSAIALEPLGVAPCYAAASANSVANVYPLAHEHCTLTRDEQPRQLIGSLDRRWQQQRNEPLYLTEQQLAAQFASIDRRRRQQLQQQQQQNVGCEQHGLYEQMLAQTHQMQSSLQQRLGHSERHKQQASGTQSKRVVAFDLGDGSVEYATKPCQNGARSVTSGESSVSGNTAADSGHESPGTTTTTNGDGCSQQRHHLCQQHTQLNQPLLRARPRRKNIQQQPNSPGCLAVNLMPAQGRRNSPVLPTTCLMLMEMSPGSQEESSTTLMHSADCSSSFGSSQLNGVANAGALSNKYSILQQNHQMATSFATATTNTQQLANSQHE